MKYTVVRYQVKSDRSRENVAYVEKVFAQLRREAPGGLRYCSFRLEDGVSFIHVSAVDDSLESNPLTSRAAFKEFASNIADRCTEPPRASSATLIGAYEAFGTQKDPRLWAREDAADAAKSMLEALAIVGNAVRRVGSQRARVCGWAFGRLQSERLQRNALWRMPSRFSHVALTVPPEQLVGVARDELLEFYGQVFAWRENEYFAIPGERIVIRAPTDTQYLTIRASSIPMRTSGYEHLGIMVDSEPELRSIHERASAVGSRFPEVELRPIESIYGDALLTFRLRFRLPLTLEIQHLRKAAQ